MRTIVTARHCEIPAELKDRAVDVVTKAAKAAHRPRRAEVVFNTDHGRKVVELQLYLPRREVKVATGEADDFRSALDSAVAKLRNQLDKTPGPAQRRSAAR